MPNIYETTTDEHLFQIMQHLKDVKEKPMNPKEFIRRVSRGLESGNMGIFVADSDDENNDQIIGAAVVEAIRTSDKGVIMWILFFWVDVKEKQLAQLLLDYIREFAIENGIKHIMCQVKRGYKAFEKYGLTEAYRVYECEVTK